MPRVPRSYLPGAVFHLTTRTQGHRAFFTPPVRSAIAAYMAAAVERSDAQLLAWAVMPNHLHMLMRQGDLPLGRLMQPLLTRVAKLVQRVHRVEGHVLERRFRDRPCQDPDHVRKAIVYTNLNPVRAGLVREPALYRWTSHLMYMGRDPWPVSMAGVCRTDIGLTLFTEREGVAAEQMRQTYGRYVAWQLKQDGERDDRGDGDNGDDPDSGLDQPPRLLAADDRWSRTFVPLFGSGPRQFTHGSSPSQDLTEIATRALAQLALPVSLDQLRSASKARPVVLARRAVVRRMSDAAYKGRAIAHYLRVSPQCVSNVLHNGGWSAV